MCILVISYFRFKNISTALTLKTFLHDIFYVCQIFKCCVLCAELLPFQCFFSLFIKSFKYCIVSAEQPQTEPIAIVNGASKSPCCKPEL